MPQGIVIGCRQARPTARSLAECLGWKYTEGYLSDLYNISCVFRYGNSMELAMEECDSLDRYATSVGVSVINSSKSIKNASNKLNSRVIMRSKEVCVPETWDLRDDGDINRIFDDHFPLVIRPFQHSQGRGVTIAESRVDIVPFLLSDFYASKLILKRTEYRAFVFNGAIMEFNEKIRSREGADEIIRNYRRGWKFKWIPYAEADKTITAVACRAVKALGLLFGAVDLCTDERGNVFVFEVNSAPGLIWRKCEKLKEKVNAFLSGL